MVDLTGFASDAASYLDGAESETDSDDTDDDSIREGITDVAESDSERDDESTSQATDSEQTDSDGSDSTPLGPVTDAAQNLSQEAEQQASDSQTQSDSQTEQTVEETQQAGQELQQRAETAESGTDVSSDPGFEQTEDAAADFASEQPQTPQGAPPNPDGGPSSAPGTEGPSSPGFRRQDDFRAEAEPESVTPLGRREVRTERLEKAQTEQELKQRFAEEVSRTNRNFSISSEQVVIRETNGGVRPEIRPSTRNEMQALQTASFYNQENPNVDIGREDVNVTRSGLKLDESTRRAIQKEQAAQQLDQELEGVDVGREDVFLEDGEVGVEVGVRQDVAAQQLEEETGREFSGEDFVLEDGELQIRDDVQSELAQEQREELAPTRIGGTTPEQRALLARNNPAVQQAFRVEGATEAEISQIRQSGARQALLEDVDNQETLEQPEGVSGQETEAPTQEQYRRINTEADPGPTLDQNQDAERAIEQFTTGGLLAEEGDSGEILTDITGVSEADVKDVSERYSQAAQFVGQNVGGAIDTVTRPVTGEEGETTAGRFTESSVATVGELGNVPAYIQAGETGVEIVEETAVQAGKTIDPNNQADVGIGDVGEATAEVTDTARQSITTQVAENPVGLAGAITGGVIASVGGGFAAGKAVRFGRQRIRTAGSKTFDIEGGRIVNPETGQVYNPRADTPDEAFVQQNRFPGAQNPRLYRENPAQAIRQQADAFTPDAVEQRYSQAGVTEGTTLKKGLDVEPDGPGARRVGSFETQPGSYESPGGFVGPELSPNFLGQVDRQSNLSLRPGLPDTGDKSTGVLVRTRVEEPDSDSLDEFNEELLDRAGETTARTKPADNVNVGEAEAVIPPEAEFAALSRGPVSGLARRAGIGSDFSVRFGGYRIPFTDRKIGGKKVPLRPVADPDLVESQGLRSRFSDLLRDERGQLGARPRQNADVDTRELREIREPVRPATDRPLPGTPTPESPLTGKDGDFRTIPRSDQKTSEPSRRNDSDRRNVDGTVTVGSVSDSPVDDGVLTFSESSLGSPTFEDSSPVPQSGTPSSPITSIGLPTSPTPTPPGSPTTSPLGSPPGSPTGSPPGSPTGSPPGSPPGSPFSSPPGDPPTTTGTPVTPTITPELNRGDDENDEQLFGLYIPSSTDFYDPLTGGILVTQSLE